MEKKNIDRGYLLPWQVFCEEKDLTSIFPLINILKNKLIFFLFQKIVHDFFFIIISKQLFLQFS